MTLPVPRLHVVTDDTVLQMRDFGERLRAVLDAGAVALHIRGRRTPGRTLLELVETARSLAGTRSTVLVNDRVDVARIAGTGVHLPAAGVPVAAARRLIGPDVPLGRSTHAADEADAALRAGADYVFLGPIWPTRSHPERPALGPAAIAAAGPDRVLAIGGVTGARIPACLAAGAYGVAAISAVWHAPDPGSAVREMLVCLEGIDG